MVESSRTARGKSFTSDQDEAICTAYLCITQDPVIGNSQAKGKFWSRVLKEYSDATQDDQRTEASIKARWQIIQKSCNKFRGYLKQIKDLHQSGMTEQNEFDQAKKTYKDNENKPFGLESCWAILEHIIKWQDLTPAGIRTAEMATSLVPPFDDFDEMQHLFVESLNANITPTSGGGGSVESPRKRPGRRKLAKEKKKAKSKKEEREDAKFYSVMDKISQNAIDKENRKAEMEERRVRALERQTELDEKRAAIEERKATRKDREMEDNIMQMDLSLVHNPQLKIYYQHRKDEIMLKWAAPSNSTAYFPQY